MRNLAVTPEAMIQQGNRRVAATRRRRWVYDAAFVVACCIAGLTVVAHADAENNRRVLVFYEQGRSTTAVALIDSEIRKILETQTAFHIDLYVEYMETNLFADPVSQRKIRDWYLQKYRDHQPDVIIAAGITPIHFMLEEHDKNFPNVPIVICGSMENWTNRPERDLHFTGTWFDPDPARTVDAALRLQPNTRHVIVVNGVAQIDKSLEALSRKVLRGYEGKLNLTYLSGLPMSSLLLQLSHTPDHTIILFGAVSQDVKGERFISATQSLPMVLAAANAPVFVLSDTLLGQGSVGGYVSSFATQGRIAAEDVMKILGGDRAQDIPILRGANIYLFDWRALRRWGFKTRDLPAGSIVLNRPPTLIEAYGRYVFGGLVLIFVQLLLILQLLSQRAKERTTRKHLHESEARLREAQSIAQCGSWVWDIKKHKLHWSNEMYRILGLDSKSVTPSGHLIHSCDDLQYVVKMKTVSEKGQPYSEEHRIVRHDGEERIVVESGRLGYDEHQKPAFVVGTLLDVTEQQRAARVLRESEERFRTMADGAPIMMWMAGLDKLCTDFNRGWLAYTGRPIEQELGNGWIDGVHPDDLQKCMATYIEAFENRRSFSREYRLRRHDGQSLWISDAGSPRFLADGTFAGYIGCALNIHDRKAAELARLELARRLMGAQEAERSRIARELHDGIGQEIALLGIQMQRASAPASPQSELRSSGMQQFAMKLAAIGVHVGRLSHQLHSSELEYLGLTVAITKLCREFSEQYPIQLTCSCTNVPQGLDNDIALTFLRIVQESLHNVVKHSEAKNVQVEMTGADEELRLTVRDDGIGFDIQEWKAAKGLGLVSMRERIDSIGGEFAIDSTPSVGTSIRARVHLTIATEPV